MEYFIILCRNHDHHCTNIFNLVPNMLNFPFCLYFIVCQYSILIFWDKDVLLSSMNTVIQRIINYFFCIIHPLYIIHNFLYTMILYYICQFNRTNFLTIFHPHNILHLSQTFQVNLLIIYFCIDFNIMRYQLLYRQINSVLIYHINYKHSVLQHQDFLINQIEAAFYYYLLKIFIYLCAFIIWNLNL